MRVVLIGAGRLGRSLVQLLGAAGVDVVLCHREDALPRERDGDVYWLTVQDAGLALTAAGLPRGRVVLHSSGVNSASVLDHPLGGVLHPMMTFPGPELGLPDLRGVGARVEGPPEARAAAVSLSRALGMVPVTCDDPVAWHLAASMVSGHLAVLFLDAASLLTDAGVQDAAALLLPLARESLNRAAVAGDDAITGPAVRGDDATILKHVERLGDEDTVYRALDARIRARRRALRPKR